MDNRPDTRSLVVWNNHTRVGELRESNNLWQFEYDPEWDGFDLCPQLPRETQQVEDGASTRPVQWFFDNLLPEEAARELIARDAKISKADAFGLLEVYGAESAGALTLLPPGEEPGRGSTRLLPFEELSKTIKNLPNAPLSLGTEKKMSLAGAQHKIPIVLNGDELYAPDASYPSTHILKPDHPDTDGWPHTVANEWFIMRLAGQLGLEVPEVRTLNVPESIYLIERFDRERQGNDVQRVHTIDACQVLSIDRVHKYNECTLENLERLIDACRLKASTRQRIFKWLLFNILVGNDDDHLKNLSFLPEGNSLTLSKHYDLISNSVYAADNGWGLASLNWPIGDAKTYAQITKSDILVLASSLRVAKRFAEHTLTTFCDSIFEKADSLIEEHQNGPTPGIIKEGELHLLRRIRYGVIADMVNQLKC